MVDVVVPVFNEERAVSTSIRRLRSYLDASFPFPAVVTVVDNGSTDATALEVAALQSDLLGVRVLHLDAKGRGRALREAWSSATAPVVAYMDADMSTSLDALLPLVAPLLSGHSDVAIGTRLARGARVMRGPKRELISRIYNLLLRACLQDAFSDAQCGFKAARTDVARRLLPQVKDDGWFFDTEFLIRAQRAGMRIHEVPVDWVDDPDSSVDIVATAVGDLKGLARVLLGRAEPAGAPTSRRVTSASPGVLTRFARIGALSTLVYLVLFFVLRPVLGEYGATALALGLCTVANTTAHRHLGFDGPISPRALVLAGSVAYATSVSFTTLALACTGWFGLASSLAVVGALIMANGVAAIGRFVILQTWMFRTARTVSSIEPVLAAVRS